MNEEYFEIYRRLAPDAEPEMIPYIDTKGGRCMIFVAVDSFNSFSEWKNAADIAAAAHFCYIDAAGNIQKNITAPPLSKQPRFLIGSNGKPQDWQTFLNVTISNEDDYKSISEQAAAKRGTMEKLFADLGPLALYQPDWPEGTKYDARSNGKNVYNRLADEILNAN